MADADHLVGTELFSRDEHPFGSRLNPAPAYMSKKNIELKITKALSFSCNEI